METDALIRQLAGEAMPVRRLAAPWLRALAWFALGLPLVLAVVWMHGADEKAGMAAADVRMVIEGIAIVATAVTAAIAAFASATPGASRRWLWLPLVPLAVWIATVGQGCVADYQAMGAAAFALRVDSDCFVPAALGGILPTIAIVLMLRRGAPMMPRATLAFAGVAVAALVNIGLMLFHAGDISLMVLVWHVGFVVVLAMVAGAVGPLFLAWKQRAVSVRGS